TVNGTTATGLSLKNSHLVEAQLQGIELKNAEIENSRLSGILLRGVRVRESQIVGCEWSDVLISGGESWGWKKRGLDGARLENCQFQRVLISECRLHKTVLRNLQLADFKLQNVDLSGQTIDGNEAFFEAVKKAQGK
ncbi:pentapeptide repeat-containing protein, partial [bacterium]|nr:pentapeptide repeat-containing protein [bacterium]